RWQPERDQLLGRLAGVAGRARLVAQVAPAAVRADGVPRDELGPGGQLGEGPAAEAPAGRRGEPLAVPLDLGVLRPAVDCPLFLARVLGVDDQAERLAEP